MAGDAAVVWFIATTVTVFGVLALGTFLAMHSYDRGRGEIHLRLRHRH
jgi:hypothetical protein